MRDEATIRLAIKKAEEMAATGDDCAKLAAKVTLNTLHWVLGEDAK